ncbi:MAG TPA: YihY/virulence factor BrkB family protein [Acidimicrobiales bacterium]|nr:YihY/virulence factor BrkB family protein [Acidimicrobiales bacterium]
MNGLERTVRRVDRYQQRHAVLGFPFAVMQKFGNDQAGAKAALIAYYGLFALFPLLLLLTTILGFLLSGHPGFRDQVLRSALADFPIIGGQLRSASHSLRGSGTALAVGVAGTVYGTFGIGQAAENAMNTVWNVPFVDWPSLVSRRLRGLAIIVLLGLATFVSAGLDGFAQAVTHGMVTTVAVYAVSTAVNFAIFAGAFTVLTAATVRLKDTLVGAVVATIAWQVLQGLGTWYVSREVRHASPTYGFFAIVIALLSWLYMGAHTTLLAAEVNVVLRHRLWPRSLTQPPLTGGDKATFERLSAMTRRRPEMVVEVSYTPAADEDPLSGGAAP